MHPFHAKCILVHYSNKTQDGTLLPRCSAPPLHGAHWVCTDIIISIVPGRWCLSCSKPSWPCGNNGNAKLQLCVRCVTRPDGTVSEGQRQRAGGQLTDLTSTTFFSHFFGRMWEGNLSWQVVCFDLHGASLVGNYLFIELLACFVKCFAKHC